MPATIQCPICQTALAPSVRLCPVCGARLPRQMASESLVKPPLLAGKIDALYDPALGEDDLFAPRLFRFPWRLLMVLLLIGALVGVVACVLGGLLLLRWPGGLRDPNALVPASASRTAVPTLALPGNGNMPGQAATLSPTLFLPTLTPAPPPTNTLPPTVTPGPCEQVVQAGDTLYGLVARCGHRHYEALIDVILEMNNLASPESLQIGQVIRIPWPTPTPGAAAPADDMGSGDEVGALPIQAFSAAEAGGEAEGMLFTPTPTLQPGVMWYTVQPGDTIIAVAIRFDANVEILSQLNPEVTFSQCDFGLDSGGPNCIVNLYQGQQLRVPAPTPTPTLSPTPSGSETATPTPTPTFNAPSLLSPGNLAHFGAAQMVTLRWVTTGVLSPGEVYLITLTDSTDGTVRTATTTETLFILPTDWQPHDGQRHTFVWNVSVGPSNGVDGLASVTFATESRSFTWDSP